MERAFGAFGKIPALGDFFRLNLPAGFVQPWDDWLQDGILTARQTLGESWDSAYMSAPLWRFTIPPGLAGSQAVLGVLMASVDRVGRQYPLTIACRYEGSDTVLPHFANTGLFMYLEDVALAMLEDGTNKDTLTQALSQCELQPSAETSVELPYAGPVAPEALLAAKGLAHLKGRALWSASVENAFLLFDTADLPQGAQMCRLFAPELPASTQTKEAAET